MEGYNFYMINLRYSIERKEIMYKMYNKNNLITVNAFEGTYICDKPDVILPSNLDAIKESKHTISNNEIACTASHIKAIKMAYENNESEAFIIEDDTHNTYKSIWAKNLKTIISEKPDDAECIIFFTSSHDLQRKLIATKEDFVPHKKTNGTGVYYINRKGMKKIYDHYIKDGNIDLSNINGRGDLLADGFALYTRMKSYHYSKPTFIDECKTSTIHQRHVTRHEINNNIIIDYFMKKEYFDIKQKPFDYEEEKQKIIDEEKKMMKARKLEQEKKMKEARKLEQEKKRRQMRKSMGMDELINYKISLLNKHKINCDCENCKLLMQEIKTLLNEKKNVITKT